MKSGSILPPMELICMRFINVNVAIRVYKMLMLIN